MAIFAVGWIAFASNFTRIASPHNLAPSYATIRLLKWESMRKAKSERLEDIALVCDNYHSMLH